jgi:hypothetical protein
VIGEENRAVGRDEAGGVEEVLDREPLALGDGVRVARAGEEDPFADRVGRSHGFVTLPSQTRTILPDTLASGRRPGEPN